MESTESLAYLYENLKYILSLLLVKIRLKDVS